ncbi:MAG: hypothetical protein WB755_08400, partial [Terriglobales bacterium]
KQRDQQIPKRIPLTPTGLLMEGDYTNYDPQAFFSVGSTVVSVISIFRQLRTIAGGLNYFGLADHPRTGLACL